MKQMYNFFIFKDLISLACHSLNTGKLRRFEKELKGIFHSLRIQKILYFRLSWILNSFHIFLYILNETFCRNLLKIR